MAREEAVEGVEAAKLAAEAAGHAGEVQVVEATDGSGGARVVSFDCLLQGEVGVDGAPGCRVLGATILQHGGVDGKSRVGVGGAVALQGGQGGDDITGSVGLAVVVQEVLDVCLLDLSAGAGVLDILDVHVPVALGGARPPGRSVLRVLHIACAAVEALAVSTLGARWEEEVLLPGAGRAAGWLLGRVAAVGDALERAA